MCKNVLSTCMYAYHVCAGVYGGSWMAHLLRITKHTFDLLRVCPKQFTMLQLRGVAFS